MLFNFHYINPVGQVVTCYVYIRINIWDIGRTSPATYKLFLCYINWYILNMVPIYSGGVCSYSWVLFTQISLVYNLFSVVFFLLKHLKEWISSVLNIIQSMVLIYLELIHGKKIPVLPDCTLQETINTVSQHNSLLKWICRSVLIFAQRLL